MTMSAQNLILPWPPIYFGVFTLCTAENRADLYHRFNFRVKMLQFAAFWHFHFACGDLCIAKRQWSELKSFLEYTLFHLSLAREPAKCAMCNAGGGCICLLSCCIIFSFLSFYLAHTHTLLPLVLAHFDLSVCWCLLPF